MFECIDRALQLKDAIGQLSKNDMELVGRINGKDDEEMLDAKPRRIGEEMMCTRHPYSFLFLSMLFLAEFCTFVVFAVLHIARVWVYFHPSLLGML